MCCECGAYLYPHVIDVVEAVENPEDIHSVQSSQSNELSHDVVYRGGG